jgi:carbonic anhydrase
MNEIDRLFAANEQFALSKEPTPLSGRPARELAVITCMDARVDPLAILGLAVGDAHIIRNAGARVTDDALRSLALAAHEFGVCNLVIMQHTKCGLAGVTEAELQQRTGASLEFRVIADHSETLRADVETVRATPYLRPVSDVAALLYDVDSGAVIEVVRSQQLSG